MGSTCFKQYDSRWGSNPYAGGTMRGDGCGPTAIADIIYAKDTSINPWTIACWLTNHGYASDGSGTYWAGIKACLEAYGFPTYWRDTMTEAFSDWAQGNYWGVLLMSAGSRGGVTWTTGGHFICVRDYKYENGEHMLLIGDPGSRNNDGWYSYERHMKGLCSQVWTCYLPGWSPSPTPTPTPTPSGGLAVDGVWGPATTKAVQKWLGTTQDGIVSNQGTWNKQYLLNCSTDSWKFSSNPSGGSDMVRALQRTVGAGVDGHAGKETITKLQKYLGLSGPDGYCGPNTVKALQNFLNAR